MTGGIEGAPDDSPRAQSSLEDAERSLEEAKDSLWAARVADAQTLEERFTLLLDVLTRNAAYGAWSTLSAETRISAQRWRAAYSQHQRPTPDMISAACRLAPAHALWLVTGSTGEPGLVQTVPTRFKG